MAAEEAVFHGGFGGARRLVDAARPAAAPPIRK